MAINTEPQLSIGRAARPGLSLFRPSVSFVRKKPLGAAGAVIILVMVAAAVLAPWIAPHDPTEADYANIFRSPSTTFLMGTDQFGRDMFSRVLSGARVSLYVSVLAVALGTGMGTLLGVTSGYLGGKLDLILQRFMDMLMAFPFLILAIAIIVAIGRDINNVVLAIAISQTPRTARVVRSSALSVKETQYVEAATALGAGNVRVIFRHVLPNCMAPVIILATAALGAAILTEASLSFLGVGTPPPHSSWGGELSRAGRFSQTAPWLAIFPGVAISLVVFGFNLFGDSLRDVLDPRLRQR